MTGGPLRLLASVLVVPLIGAAVGVGLRQLPASTHADAMSPSIPASEMRQLRESTVAEFCAAAVAPSEVCDADTQYRLFAGASLLTAGGGLLVIVAIVLAAAAGRDHRWLLAVFRPGLYLTAVGATALILAHAAIVAVGLTLVVRAAATGMPPFILGAILVGALAGVRAVPRAIVGTVRRARVFVLAGRVSRVEAPELWQRVEAVAARLRALPPDEIVVGLGCGFFVTESDVDTPNGACRGRTLCCSLPLARLFTLDEFTAVVAHELGHFRGGDTAISQRFYPIYRGTAQAIVELEASGDGLRRIALMPALALFDVFFARFAASERALARERELAADAAAVEATSARVLAAALVKMHACQPLWDEAFEEAARTPIQGRGPGPVPAPNASALFAAAAGRAVAPALLDGILETRTAHPTDSHPSLAERLEALGVTLADVTMDALRLRPVEPASVLIPTGIHHEQALSLIVALSRDGEAPNAGR